MKCPYCGAEESKVIDSRPTEDSERIRRRRECLSCHMRFTTYEVVETVPLVVIKKDSSREPFDRQKLLNAMVRACAKRPVSYESLERAVSSIEQTLLSSYDREIPSVRIGELTMQPTSVELASGVTAKIAGKDVAASTSVSVSPSTLSIDVNNKDAIAFSYEFTFNADKNDLTRVSVNGTNLKQGTDYNLLSDKNGIRVYKTYLSTLKAGTYTAERSPPAAASAKAAYRAVQYPVRAGRSPFQCCRLFPQYACRPPAVPEWHRKWHLRRVLPFESFRYSALSAVLRSVLSLSEPP